MKKIFTFSFRTFGCSIMLLLASASCYATHIVGADLSYTYVSGDTYKIKMVLYGDCGPASAASFGTFPISSPQVCIYDGSTYASTVSLAIQPPSAGVEVTLVGAGVITQCADASSVFPGITKFVYSATITLPHTSATWRFVYNGNNGSGATAGRAAAITNLNAPSSTSMQIIDTLNNAGYNNTSAALSTTMPYYYPLNQNDNYYPAAADPDGDSLAISFVSATNGNETCGTIGGDVTYTGTAWAGTPISQSTPLAVTADSFHLNPSTGQLSFYPNVTQRGVIVYNVREFRGGVLVGSCQREMTVIVMTPPSCAGTPVAGGVIATAPVACGVTTVVLTDTGSTAAASYQWQSSPDSIGWSGITGAISASYSFSALSANTFYRCIVSCASGGATDTTAGIKITYTPVCPCVLSSAGTALVSPSLACSSTTITLADPTYAASGVTLQWQSSADSTIWSNISAATSASYSFAGLTATAWYRLKLICSSGSDSLASAGVRVTYTASCPCYLSAGTVIPSSASACSTATVTLTNTGYSTSGGSLQWQSSPDSTTWANIPGATSAAYSFTGLATTTYYRMTITCTAGGTSVASAGVKITYTTSCVCTGTPVAGTATASTTFCSACSLTLGLTGSSVADSLGYQWQQSATGSAPWSNILGATTFPYTFTPSGAYYYRCRVTCLPTGAFTYSSSVFVSYQYTIIADSVNLADAACLGPIFFVKVNGISSLLRLKTYYGDGTTDSIALTTAGSTSYTYATHAYYASGCHTVKQVLYYNSQPQDSITFSCDFISCKSLPIKLYWDVNGDCIKESAEPYNAAAVFVKVDSNGIPVDTLSATGGLYYKAYGPAGTVYSFSVISTALYASCPSSGILYDTILSTLYTYPAKYVGLSCSGSSAFDLAVTDVIPVTGEHDQWGNIYPRNNYCMPTNATVTLHYSKKYNSGHPTTHTTPVSYSDSTIIWDVVGLSSNTAPVDLYYALWANSGSYLTPGDTVRSYVTITPILGDCDTSNNSCVIIDTVKAGCDPNEMSVSPAGCIPVDTTTQLQYTINFVNTGNDTAFNISVIDTLSPNVNIHSLKIAMASATMNTSVFNDGTYNIAKFDFPQINLLDSVDHYAQCSGSVIFNINTLPGLPDGAAIFNHAGIFFDINPVVMTNTVENILGCPTTQVSPLSNSHKVSIFPNPATDELTIKMDQGAYTSLTITNSIGQQMEQHPVTAAQTNVSISKLSPGLYYITFRGDNGTTVQKFVKL